MAWKIQRLGHRPFFWPEAQVSRPLPWWVLHGRGYVLQLGLDCLPALSQGTASLCLVVDLLFVIFIVAAHIRCLVIGVVLVCLVDCLMFLLSYMRPCGLFSNRLLGPLTWYLVSHDGLLIMLPLPPISADALWDSICFQYLRLLYLDHSTLAIGTITQADVAFSELYK